MIYLANKLIISRIRYIVFNRFHSTEQWDLLPRAFPPSTPESHRFPKRLASASFQVFTHLPFCDFARDPSINDLVPQQHFFVYIY